jgi:hypothetical protein
MVVLTILGGLDVLRWSDSAVGEGVGDLCACSLMGSWGLEGGMDVLDGMAV